MRFLERQGGGLAHENLRGRIEGAADEVVGSGVFDLEPGAGDVFFQIDQLVVGVGADDLLVNLHVVDYRQAVFAFRQRDV